MTNLNSSSVGPSKTHDKVGYSVSTGTIFSGDFEGKRVGENVGLKVGLRVGLKVG